MNGKLLLTLVAAAITAAMCSSCGRALPQSDTALINTDNIIKAPEIKEEKPLAPNESTVSLPPTETVGDEHVHTEAASPQTINTPISGYCGNTVTTVHIDNISRSFWGDDSVVLTDILINLDYRPEKLCECIPEISANTEFGADYRIDLSKNYVRCDKGQADLTAQQTETIHAIVERVKNGKVDEI